MDSPERETGKAIEELLAIVMKLRGPSGCSWDRKQTPKTLCPFMLEEAYEVADAAASGDTELLKKELGDLLLHVMMSAVICSEDGSFTPADVVRGISRKLVRRHPHVFEESCGLSPDEVEKQWEAIKAGEKAEEGFFGSLPSGMPALQTAWRIQQRASEVGFDWPDAEGARGKVLEELEEFEEALQSGDGDASREELSDLLFSVANYCRLQGYEPESILREGNRKFVERFTAMERILGEKGLNLQEAGLEAMERAWREAGKG